MRKPGTGGKAPSREGKKQVIAFLQPLQAEAAYAKAAKDDKTNQEVIGDALNAEFAFYGKPPPVPPGHFRIVRRTQKRAEVRSESTSASCRSGRVAYGGWFDEEIVAKLGRHASEFSLSVQAIIEHGLELITGVGPAVHDPDAFGKKFFASMGRDEGKEDGGGRAPGQEELEAA